MERPVLRIAAAFGIILLLTGCGLRPHLDILRGNAAFSLGDFQEANIRYLKGLDKPGNSYWFLYNLGNVYYALGEGAAAADAWEESLPAENRNLQFRIYFNKGIYEYDLGQYDLAYNYFREALLIDPGSIDTKKNLEITLKKLDAVRGTESDIIQKNEDTGKEKQELFRILDYVRRNEEFIREDNVREMEQWEKDW